MNSYAGRFNSPALVEHFPLTCKFNIVILAIAQDCCHSYPSRSYLVSTLTKAGHSPIAQRRYDSTSGRRMKSNLFAHHS